jgi:hypothetical protein
MEFANQLFMSGADKALRLLRINCFLKWAVKKHHGNVHVENLLVVVGSKCCDGANGLPTDGGGEGLLKV